MPTAIPSQNAPKQKLIDVARLRRRLKRREAMQKNKG